MKRIRRQPQRQVPDKLKVAARLAPKSNVLANPHVIKASKSSYGPRPRWGQIQYAQAALCVIYPNGIPANVNISALTRRVQAQLNEDRAYHEMHFPPVSRQTVMRAIELVRAANA